MTLSQTRAKDRKIMLERMAALADRHGASFASTPAPLDPHGVSVTLSTERAYVAMTFTPEAERKGRGRGYLGHWVCNRGNLFRRHFDGYASNFPHHKATASAPTFEDFETVLERMLGLVVSGDAFDQSGYERKSGWAGQ